MDKCLLSLILSHSLSLSIQNFDGEFFWVVFFVAVFQGPTFTLFKLFGKSGGTDRERAPGRFQVIFKRRLRLHLLYSY